MTIVHYTLIHSSNRQSGPPHPGVTDLGAVGVDCSGSIDLAQFALHVCKSLAHVPCMLIRKDLGEYKGTIHVLIFIKRDS